MKIKNDTTTSNKPKDDRLAKLQRKIEQAISAKAPSAATTFSEAYELIEIAITNQIPQKEIIDLVNQTFNLKLHALSFRTLLKNEREARLTSGHRVTCPTCSQALASCHLADSESIPADPADGTQQQEVA